MSYGIMPCSFKIESLIKLYGSKQLDLIKHIEGKLLKLDEYFDAKGGWEPAIEIATQYLNGDKAFFECEHSGTKEWYVIEVLVEFLGEFLTNDKWYPFHDIEPLYDIACIYGLDQDRKYVLKEPFDFPVVFTIYNNMLTDARENTKESSLPEEQKKQMLAWIAVAEGANEDLMLFYH